MSRYDYHFGIYIMTPVSSGPTQGLAALTRYPIAPSLPFIRMLSGNHVALWLIKPNKEDSRHPESIIPPISWHYHHRLGCVVLERSNNVT